MPCRSCGGSKRTSPPVPSLPVHFRSLSEGSMDMASQNMITVELVDGNIGEHLIAFAQQNYGYRSHGDRFLMREDHAKLDRRVRVVDEPQAQGKNLVMPASQRQETPPPADMVPTEFGTFIRSDFGDVNAARTEEGAAIRNDVAGEDLLAQQSAPIADADEFPANDPLRPLWQEVNNARNPDVVREQFLPIADDDARDTPAFKGIENQGEEMRENANAEAQALLDAEVTRILGAPPSALNQPTPVVAPQERVKTKDIVLQPKVYDFGALWGINAEKSAVLHQAGVRSLDGLLMMEPKQLSAMIGVPELTAQQILKKAKAAAR